MADLVISVIIIGPDGFHQLSQSALVFWVALCEGNSAGLLVEHTRHPACPSPWWHSREPPSYNAGQAGNPPVQWDPRHGRPPPAEPPCSPPRRGQYHRLLRRQVVLSGDIPLACTCCLSSGQQLLLPLLIHLWSALWVSLRRWVAVWQSKTWLNRLITGGTLSRLYKVLHATAGECSRATLWSRWGPFRTGCPVHFLSLLILHDSRGLVYLLPLSLLSPRHLEWLVESPWANFCLRSKVRSNCILLHVDIQFS